MCGIVGFFGTRDRFRDLAGALPAMTDALRHRGPDDRGEWSDAAAGIGLGHRRLAIIDLSPNGHQPMVSASGRYRIVFNGEIYNFRSLRDRLEHGFRFVGGSDTEVILAAVEAWGLVAAVKEFVGIFAFGLWDATERQLHLVRDHLGVKPVYYSFDGQQLTFASELKALRAAPRFDATVDRTSLSLFLKYGYLPGSRTIFASTRKLEPATVLTIDLDGLRAQSPRLERYWAPPTQIADQGAARDDASVVGQLDELVRTAVREQLVSDVPLGAFLSGGIDSSTVVAAMQAQSATPVKTFAIGFTEAAYNEAQFASDVARHLGTQHTELYVTPKEAQEVIPLLPNMFDEPFADVSQIPTYLVSRLARRHVTVSLSGDGGDELFFGYTKYHYALRWHRRLQSVPRVLRRSLAAPLRGVVRPGSRQGLLRSKPEILVELLGREHERELFDYFASWQSPETVVLGLTGATPPLVADEETAGVTEFVQLMSYIDIKSYLAEDILTKLDRTSMAVALEGRVPLLDYRLVEFAMQLPLRFKFRDGVSKWALKQVLYKYVPREIVDRPKMGFGVPIGTWLKGPLRAWAEDLLDENRLRSEGYLDASAVRTIWREHVDGRFDWQFPLWNLLSFQAWRRVAL